MTRSIILGFSGLLMIGAACTFDTSASSSSDGGTMAGEREDFATQLHRGFLTVRFEAQHKAFQALSMVVGSQRLESLGFWLADMWPMRARL